MTDADDDLDRIRTARESVDKARDALDEAQRAFRLSITEAMEEPTRGPVADVASAAGVTRQRLYQMLEGKP